MSMMLEFSIFPLDKGESLSGPVSRALDIIDKSGMEYRLTPMGTVLEGEWDPVMDVVKRCFEKMREDCDRITLSMKVDYRKGKEDRLKGKIASLEAKLGRKLKV